MRKQTTYAGFIDALWRGLCVRQGATLASGGAFSIGDIIVEDSAVTLVKHWFLGSNESVRLTWHKLKVEAADSSFVIG